ncbi:hypothetical protein NCCP2222_19160 [Sporosarcina sp. NCCP-2222]|uniref:hypothetical protein n=1 Tax=Sporosarcina sp. NCCP-2222 TaxID=2935073 RepID=UPI00208AFC46|nr:hypothetical protein [Sporosarcina sp. NCCP-2222]GKV55969.1 hypothetical protein NCCP2222_19160 [Sporosarcina sp. NCCP-2222]
MTESVGKISLDIDLRSDLNKQINHIADNIGTQLSKTLQQHVKGTMNGMKGMMPNFGMPKKTFTMPKKTMKQTSTAASSDVDAEATKAQIASLEPVLDNTNAKIEIQKKKLAELKEQYSAGMSDGVKLQIEQLERVMQSSEGRINALNTKLNDLKFSYDNAVSAERKNKLADQISKTEMQISNLINKSDKANQKIMQLESGFSESKKNALYEKIVNTESALLRLQNSADKTKNKMTQLNDGMNNAGKNADKAERPVRKLSGSLGKAEKAAKRTGSAFSLAGNQGNNMARSFQMALTRILKQVLVFAILYKAIRGFTSYMGSALKTNNDFMHSLGQIRTNLQVAFMPIYQAILPAINALMRGLATVTAYIASFISAIFGKTYKQSYQAAQGLNAARSAMEGYGGAAKKAAKDAKKASLGLASFDEINSLAFNDDAGADDGGAGGGGGGGGGIAPLIEPDMDTSLIDAKMAELLGSVKKLLSPTIDSLKNLWDAMAPFRTFLAQGAIDFYNNFLKPVGLWVFGEGIPRFFNILAEGFRSVDWAAMNDALNGLWLVLTPFTINVGEGLLWFFENVLVPLGAWTMNEIVPRFLTAVGIAIAVLNNVIEALKPTGQWLFDNFLKPLGVWTGGVILKTLDLLAAGLKKVSDWIKDNQELFADIILVLGSFALAWGVVTGAIKAWGLVAALTSGISAALGAAIGFLASPIGIATVAIGSLIAIGVLVAKNWDDLSDKAKVVFTSIHKDIIKPAIDLVKKIIKDMIDMSTSWWDKWGKKLVDGIKDATKNIGLLFTNLWVNLLQPLIKKMLDTMTNLWDKHLKDLIKEIGDFVGKLISAATDIFNKFIMPIVNWLVKTLGPVFAEIFRGVMDVIGTALGAIIDAAKGIIKALGGIVDFIAGVFTGDWERAWNGIKTFMSGIGDGLVSIFRGAINTIIDAFNWMIRQINNLKIDVPEWVPGIGGKRFGMSIPSIPKLARGGIVDQPTIAMVGERGKEAVVPLENTPFVNTLASALGSAVMAAMQMSGGGGKQQGAQGNDVVLNLDGATLARILMPYLTREEKRIGTPIIKPI